MTNQVIDEEVYISAPISTVWDALTNPNITELYWGDGTRIKSDWQKGSTIYYRRDGEIMDKSVRSKIEVWDTWPFSHGPVPA